MDPEESEESIKIRTDAFNKYVSEQDEKKMYTEDWYREQYPMFPEPYYAIFAKFSNTPKSEKIPETKIDSLISKLGID